MTEKLLFVSWSKPASSKIAQAFCEIIESLPLSIKCWVSQRISDLPQGPYDHKRILDAAKNSFACVSIITPGNVSSPWLFFEAGIFYGSGKDVYGLLSCGITHQALRQSNNPIEGYCSYASDCKSYIDLIRSINKKANNVDESRFLKSATSQHEIFKLAIKEACVDFADLKMKDEMSL